MSTTAPAVEDEFPLHMEVRRRINLRAAGRITGYGTEPFSGERLVRVLWDGDVQPVACSPAALVLVD